MDNLIDASDVADHAIVNVVDRPRNVPLYECSCGESLQADPEVFDEAFAWHRENPSVSYVQPCGTEAAYRRHLRMGETPCDACRSSAVKADKRRADRRRGGRRA